MQQQIKVIELFSQWGARDVEGKIETAWKAATSPDGVRPALEAAGPLGGRFVLLVFSGDLARASSRGITTMCTGVYTHEEDGCTDDYCQCWINGHEAERRPV